MLLFSGAKIIDVAERDSFFHERVSVIYAEFAVLDHHKIVHRLLVVDSNIFPGILRLRYNLAVTCQIAVLPDGTLIVPADLDGTYRVDLSKKYAMPFTELYSNNFMTVIGDQIIELHEYSPEAQIIPMNGGQEYTIQVNCAVVSFQHPNRDLLINRAFFKRRIHQLIAKYTALPGESKWEKIGNSLSSEGGFYIQKFWLDRRNRQCYFFLCRVRASEPERSLYGYSIKM